MRVAVASCLLLCAVVAAQESGTPNPPSPPLANRPAPTRVRVSQGVMKSLILKKVDPKYPKEARNQHIEGAVIMGIVIGKTGDVSELRVISGNELLVPSAVEAAKQWKYRPYLFNGQPVEIESQITINYQLHR